MIAGLELIRVRSRSKPTGPAALIRSSTPRSPTRSPEHTPTHPAKAMARSQFGGLAAVGCRRPAGAGPIPPMIHLSGSICYRGAPSHARRRDGRGAAVPPCAGSDGRVHGLRRRAAPGRATPCTRPTSSTAAPSRASTRAWPTPSSSAAFPTKSSPAGSALRPALPAELVYAGFSLGVLPAQKLAQTRPGARGALLFYACVPAKYFGPWPAGVPAQIHGMDADPIFASTPKATSTPPASWWSPPRMPSCTYYPGDQHYFAEPGLPSLRRDCRRAAEPPRTRVPAGPLAAVADPSAAVARTAGRPRVARRPMLVAPPSHVVSVAECVGATPIRVVPTHSAILTSFCPVCHVDQAVAWRR